MIIKYLIKYIIIKYLIKICNLAVVSLVFNVCSCLGLVVAVVSFVLIAGWCWFWALRGACGGFVFLVVGVFLLLLVFLGFGL